MLKDLENNNRVPVYLYNTIWRAMLKTFWIRKMSSGESISTALKSVLSKIKVATSKRSEKLPAVTPRLVAVTKTKPVTSIISAYDSGQRYFGENYVTEIVEKGSNPDILKLSDIRWHFIGHLQRNKVGKLLSVPNLYMVETVDSEKLALSLDSGWKKLKQPRPLKVMVQVNTSAEENKSGCEPEKTCELYRFVTDICPNLELVGLMTIGSFDHDLSTGPSPDFLRLVKCREDVCKEFGLTPDQVELSMGMSADYEHAIELGSTNVRVGSTIFGARDNQKKAGASSEEKTPETNPEPSQSIDHMVSDIAGVSLGEA